jgi:hypothetical protein
MTVHGAARKIRAHVYVVMSRQHSKHAGCLNGPCNACCLAHGMHTQGYDCSNYLVLKPVDSILLAQFVHVCVTVTLAA